HLMHSRERDETLGQALKQIHSSTGHQAQTLQLLQKQFDTGRDSAERMTETLGSFSSALTGLAENNNRSTEVLSGLLRSTEQRESQLVETIRRMQRWTLGLLISVGALL